MKYIVSTLLLLASLTACQQEKDYKVPRIGAEDTEQIMSDKYWSYWTPEVQARIDADIEKNRKADAQFAVGDIAPDTKVSIEQISSDFGFGASSFNWDQLGKKEYNDIYKNLFGTLFNRATVAFYWRELELEQGKKRFLAEEWDSEDWWNNCEEPHLQPHWRRPPTEPVIKWCEEHGVTVHGHPLVWGHMTIQQPAWIRDGISKEEREWLDANDKITTTSPKDRSEEFNAMSIDDFAKRLPEYQQKLDGRVFGNARDIVNRYDGRVQSWDVVNECYLDYRDKAWMPGSKFTKTPRYGLMPGDYVYRSFDLVSKLNKGGAKLNINETQSDSYKENADIYSGAIKHLLKRGAKIDMIGIQVHLMRKHRNAELVAQGKEIWNPERAYYVLDKLAENNLPMCMSEITITSPGSDYRGEMIQSIIAVNLYRLWFSYPNMTAITWWNLVDDCGYKGEPTISGLFTRDMKPKLAYYALYNLIHKEWRTNVEVAPDSDGNIAWRGFTGKYRISWTDSKGEKHEATYELKK
nr:endo-1,4-beta-xylanase [uncultured bacterium]